MSTAPHEDGNYTIDAQHGRGDWTQTFSGKQFWPMSPRVEDVCIEDIAHALSMLCRYGGHCLRFYSVAEHSVLLSRAVSPENALWALLHDAAEAYLVDVPRPIKRHLGGYAAAEVRVMQTVTQKFGLQNRAPGEVLQADNRILNDERAQNMAPTPRPWFIGDRPLGVTLQFWTPAAAELHFLQRFDELTGADIVAKLD